MHPGLHFGAAGNQAPGSIASISSSSSSDISSLHP
jgi:hypothetical protein